MKKLCIFCGASSGRTTDGKNLYTDQAKQVGEILATTRRTLVYGGGRVGVMGVLADAVLQHGGQVIGVIPESLMTHEIGHSGVSQLYVVPDMHSRKKMMYDLSDAFLVLPGGMGTLDEMFEILTWAQLGFHQKPIYLLNDTGFYDHLLKYIAHSSAEGFIKPEHTKLIRELKTTKSITDIQYDS